MYKKLVALVLVLVVTFTFMMSTQPSADQLPADSFAQYLPADAVLYYEVDDHAASMKRYEGLALYSMFTDPEITDFINAIAEMIDQKEADASVVDTLKTVQEEILPKLKFKKFYAAVCKLTEDSQKLSAFMGADFTAENKEGIKGAIEKLLTLVEEVAPNNEFVREDIQLEGYSVIKFGIQGKADTENVYFAMSDSKILFVNGRDSLDKVLNNIKNPPEESLLKNPEFIKAAASVNSKDGLCIMNNGEYLESIGSVMDMAFDMLGGNAALKNLLGKLIESIKGYSAMGSHIEGKGCVDESFATVSDKIFESFPSLKEPVLCQAKAAKILSKDSLMFIDGSVPIGPLYDDIMKIFGQELGVGIARLEEALQISLKEDIIASLGNEIAFGVTFQGMSVGPLLAIEVKDAASLRDIFLLLSNMDMMAAAQIQKSTFEGLDIYSRRTPGMSIILDGVSLCVTDEWLLIGGVSAVKDAIKRTPENNLLNNEVFKRTMQFVGQDKFQGVYYFDTKTVFTIAYDFIIPNIQGALAANPDFDITTIPSKRAFTENLEPVFGYQNYMNGVSRSKIYSPWPLAFTQVLNVLNNINSINAIENINPDNEEEVPEDVF